MWLLHVHDRRLKGHGERNKPPYAILSHTWSLDPDEEVNFQDIRGEGQSFKSKPGYAKIDRTCLQAIRDGLEWVWIDTCCIDKSSSTELQEAINRMWTWYCESACCYVLLSDLPFKPLPLERPREEELEELPRPCRWFYRGWTLQELLAPRSVWFFNAQWSPIGNRDTLACPISAVTGIGQWLLRLAQSSDQDVSLWASQLRDALERYSVAQRMSWAARRTTTRLEDEAYCLLFDTNMNMLCGEGSKAFKRLQEGIIREKQDHTILVRTHRRSKEAFIAGLLAESAADFRDCGKVVRWPSRHSAGRFEVIGDIINATLPVLSFGHPDSNQFAVLNCGIEGDLFSPLCLRLYSLGSAQYCIRWADTALPFDQPSTVQRMLLERCETSSKVMSISLRDRRRPPRTLLPGVHGVYFRVHAQHRKTIDVDSRPSSFYLTLLESFRRQAEWLRPENGMVISIAGEEDTVYGVRIQIESPVRNQVSGGKWKKGISSVQPEAKSIDVAFMKPHDGVGGVSVVDASVQALEKVLEPLPFTKSLTNLWASITTSQSGWVTAHIGKAEGLPGDAWAVDVKF